MTCNWIRMMPPFFSVSADMNSAFPAKKMKQNWKLRIRQTKMMLLIILWHHHKRRRNQVGQLLPKAVKFLMYCDNTSTGDIAKWCLTIVPYEMTTVLGVVSMSLHLNFTSLWSRYYHPHFIGKELKLKDSNCQAKVTERVGEQSLIQT